MRRIKTAIFASFLLALALPAAAPATLSEVGVLGTTNPATVASCPASPCLAVSRTTGFQVKVATAHNPLGVPRDGSIVGWTITLGKPNATQIKFFNTNEGGVSEAAIAVLRAQKSPNLTYKLIAQGPLTKLQPYFGKTVQFPLETTIKVKKGDIVALTVPTWAPALALGFGNDTSWRASRPKKQCTTTSAQTAHTQINTPIQYYCLYQTARLTYSATLISTP
ncbi:MAG: hypothetical protein QOK19_792 [Solirubrobacteraceae bacterium]|jgi:hypothetical protein|nr:hypothetical protein [Solirubrobacterales bacterium]MEA2215231.1 hypothetical protein [Solirubrobacteraceae bacterium]